MIDDRQERIRLRAHRLWEDDGKPEGKEQEHWEQASREIEAEAEESDRTSGAASEQGPAQPIGGLSSSLQPGGTIPGGGPGATEGSLGTGGGSTAGRPSGTLKR